MRLNDLYRLVLTHITTCIRLTHWQPNLCTFFPLPNVRGQWPTDWRGGRTIISPRIFPKRKREATHTSGVTWHELLRSNCFHTSTVDRFNAIWVPQTSSPNELHGNFDLKWSKNRAKNFHGSPRNPPDAVQAVNFPSHLGSFPELGDDNKNRSYCTAPSLA